MATKGQRLTGRTALITGAGRGMGRAVARMFADHGARVAVNDLDPELAEAAVAELQQDGAQALCVPGDVTDSDVVSAMVQKVVDAFGTVDILVNNAGILYPTRLEQISEEEWDQVIAVNVKGVFLCTKAVLPRMKENGWGRIVHFSSSAGKSVSTLGGAHYTTSKAAVLGFSRAVAKEMAPYGITSNAICPGLIDTEMVRHNCSPERLADYEASFPISRLGTCGEAGDLVLFLSSDESSYITGASIDINGGDLMV